jgi:phenylpropionate dioxygenase-like ring-hydroxylating dioxygenase large terminal subunit
LHATLPFERYPFAVKTESEFAANWKSGMYTFMEGYHITTAHRKTPTPQIVTKQNPFFNFFDIQLFGPHSTLTSERNFDWQPSTPVVKFSIDQMPPMVLPSGGTDAKENFATHPAINRIKIPNFGVETITIFPNTCLQPLGGGYIWMSFWPLAADRTLVEVYMYSEHAPNSLREEFAAANASAATRDVLTEDFSICELQQRGFAMAANKFQYFGENEGLIRHFVETVNHYLGESGS